MAASISSADAFVYFENLEDLPEYPEILGQIEDLYFTPNLPDARDLLDNPVLDRSISTVFSTILFL